MTSLIMKPLLWLALSQVVMVFSESQYDFKWDEDGIVYLKPTLDLSMCVKTERFDDEKVSLTLISCTTLDNGYIGVSRLHLEKAEGYFRRIRVFNYPRSSIGGIFSCLWAGIGENSKVLTDRCNLENPWHLWNLRPLGGNKVQWVHKETGNCVGAPSMSNGTDLRTTKCNLDDKTQIWEAEFLQAEYKFVNAGKISLKSMLDQSLCFSSQQNDTQPPYNMNVAPCTSKRDGDDIELGKVGGGYFQFKGLTSGLHPTFICIGVEMSNDKIKLLGSGECNYNEGLQHWAFLETGKIAEVLIYNWVVKKCIQVNDDRKTTKMTSCDYNDVKQIWKIQHA